MTRTRRRSLALALGALLLTTERASAQPHSQPLDRPQALPTRNATFHRAAGDVIVMSESYADALDGAVTKKLKSGLPTVIAMRAYVFEEQSTVPLALGAHSCRIVFDLWDELFRIELTDPTGSRTTVALNLEGVNRVCGSVQRLPIATTSMVRPTGSYFVATLVEINPLSPQVLEKIRRWVARPGGSAAIGPGDALFGSFVGLFVNRVREADRHLVFRSQTFTPAKLPPLEPTKPTKPTG